MPPRPHPKGPPHLGSAMHLPLPLFPAPATLPSFPHPWSSAPSLAQIGNGSRWWLWHMGDPILLQPGVYSWSSLLHIHLHIPPCSSAGLNTGRHSSSASLAQHGRIGNAEQLCTIPVSANKQMNRGMASAPRGCQHLKAILDCGALDGQS